MATYRRRQPKTMSDEERDKRIVNYRDVSRLGWTTIATLVNMSPSGARSAYDKAKGYGRYQQREPDETWTARSADRQW